MPDNIFKSDDIDDEGSGVTITDLGPEEKFAKNVLTSLKDKISGARERLKDIERQIREKRDEAEEIRENILEEANEEADRIREDARQEAEQLLQEKQNEVEQAREEGYDDGYDDGIDDAEDEMAEYLEQTAEVLEEAKRRREAFLEENTQALIEVAGELAEHIVREEVNVNEEVVNRVVSAAIEEVSDVQEITVKVSPDDAQRVRDIKDDIKKEHPNLEEITVSPDEKMQRGGCRIRTDFGNIQATLRGQVEHLTEQLVERTRNHTLDSDSQNET